MHILTIITTQMDSDIRRDHLINLGIVTETCITHITLQNPKNSIAKITIATITIMLTILHLSVFNNSELIGSLQSQIIGLCLQPLQQAMLNSILTFDGAKKAEFATWAQSVENAARICNLDAVSIALSKLQGALLKSAIYLEGKETSAGRKLSRNTLKQHLTSNYSEFPYDIHAINAYDTLQEGPDESSDAYLHKVQDILEHIDHTNNV